jgi:hypothetical protein
MSARKPRSAEKKPAGRKLRLSKETLKDLANDKRSAGEVATPEGPAIPTADEAAAQTAACA